MGRKNIGAYHQPREPHHLLVIDPVVIEAQCRFIAQLVAHFLHGGRKSHGEYAKTVYLFMDDSSRVYVVPETHPFADRWVEIHTDWLCAVFHRETENVLEQVVRELS